MREQEWMLAHSAAPEQIDAPACLEKLLEQMEAGLSGRGRIPMLPSYLSTRIAAPEGAVCPVMDAGGTNLRTARAGLEEGKWHLVELEKTAMPGTGGEELSFRAFYGALAKPLKRLDGIERVGCCFS